MKKFLCLLMIVCLLPIVALAEANDIKLSQIEYAAHGDRGFAVMTVALQGDVIVAANIDEFQFMAADSVVGVPNSDGNLGKSFPEGQVLASKKVNSEFYSANMANAGSTVAIADNFAAIEAYVTGKTVAELEAELEGKTAEDMIDVVSGATLADTINYIKGLIEAAKAAQ